MKTITLKLTLLIDEDATSEQGLIDGLKLVLSNSDYLESNEKIIDVIIDDEH